MADFGEELLRYMQFKSISSFRNLELILDSKKQSLYMNYSLSILNETKFEENICHFYFFVVQCALEGILRNTGRTEISGLLDTGVLPRVLSGMLNVPLESQTNNKDILDWLWPRFLSIQGAMFRNMTCLNYYTYIKHQPEQ
jgi:hypothetical protein